MQRNMEIRHMAFHLEQLADILDTSEGWRTFLFLIPRNLDDLSKEEYETKYTGKNETIIDTESKKSRCSPSKLLLEEWGISGKVRPTVGHLLTLLVRANQIRAAEFLTNLLGEKPPARPKVGPGAPIDVTLPEDHQTESLLNGISYPSSTILQNNVESATINNNRDYYDKTGPEKWVEIKDSSKSIPDGKLPVLSSSNNDNRTASSDSSDIRNPQMCVRYPDQIAGPSNTKKESKLPRTLEEGPTSVNTLPMLSALGLKAGDGQEVESSKLQNDRNYDRPQEYHDEVHAPNLSIFGRVESEKVCNTAMEPQEHSIPALTALLGHGSDNQQPHSNSTNRTHDSIPMLSLLGSDSNSSNALESDSSSSAVTTQSNSSVSDLLKFSNSLTVAQYSYQLLRELTDGFNTDHFTNRNILAPNGRSIGAGGFGAVFLALNLSPSIPVAAVKRLDPDKYKCREKFHLEQDILSKHSHPNVVSLLGCSSDGPQLCLVYEFLMDGNLEVALLQVRNGQRQMPAPVRLTYLRDIASAIAFLHEQAKIIHRDVKSANILLHGAVAKLCDFGLIKRTTSRTTTSIIGTNAYMAPEAVRGDVSPALDIFAFGIVIAETVTGEPALAEKESRSEIDLAGYVGRHRAEGRDLRTIVDGRAAGDDHAEGQWREAGKTLLEIALKCMGEKWSRPTSSALTTVIANVRLVPLPRTNE